MAEASVTRKAKVKKIKRACRACGKTRDLMVTECCNNWICDPSINYRKNKGICNWEHHRYSCCHFHYVEGHEGNLRDCKECMEMGPSEYDFEEVTCVSCGFQSQTMDDFAYQLNEGFYCVKEECQAKCKPPPSKSAKNKVEKKIKRACCLCSKTKKLTKTECCNNWICDDAHTYRLFSFDLNSCWRNHHRYSCCAYHHNENHEGRWQDCEECTEMGPLDYDLEEVTCVSCGFKSQTMDDFAFQINTDFYCKKDECQKTGKQHASRCKHGVSTKRKTEVNKGGENEISRAEEKQINRTVEKEVRQAEENKVSRAEVKEVNEAEIKRTKLACRLCGKGLRLTRTKCCNSWICDDSHKFRSSSYLLNSCFKNHEKYSCCAFHHSQGHEGKWEDCERCRSLGSFNFDFVDSRTNNSNFEQENVNTTNIPKVPFILCLLPVHQKL